MKQDPNGSCALLQNGEPFGRRKRVLSIIYLFLIFGQTLRYRTYDLFILGFISRVGPIGPECRRGGPVAIGHGGEGVITLPSRGATGLQEPCGGGGTPPGRSDDRPFP